MNSIQYSTKTYFSNQKSKQIKLDQFAKSNCVTTYGTTSSGRLRSIENCFDFNEGSSGLIIVGVCLGVFTIVYLLILSIKKNYNDDSENLNDDFKNIDFLSNKTNKESLLTDLLVKIKESYFPTLSISESFVKGNYLILKDLSGKILSESNIKGNNVILTDLNGNVISEVKFRVINKPSNKEFRVNDKFNNINKSSNKEFRVNDRFNNLNKSSNKDFRVNGKSKSIDSQKNDNSSKLNSTNLKQSSGTDLIRLIRKIQESEFPEASLLNSELKSDYVIVKDSSGNVLSQIKITEINKY